MAAQNLTVITLNFTVLVEKRTERKFEVIRSFRNRSAYGQISEAWTVKFKVSDDGQQRDKIDVSGDDISTSACLTAVKELAIRQIAEKFAKNVERLQATVLRGTNSVVVFIRNSAWTGPDPDDDFLMKV